jgi:hypothetical protein
MAIRAPKLPPCQNQLLAHGEREEEESEYKKLFDFFALANKYLLSISQRKMMILLEVVVGGPFSFIREDAWRSRR